MHGNHGLASSQPPPKEAAERLGTAPNLERSPPPAILEEVNHPDQQGDLQKRRNPAAQEEPKQTKKPRCDSGEQPPQPADKLHNSLSLELLSRSARRNAYALPTVPSRTAAVPIHLSRANWQPSLNLAVEG